MKNTAFVELVGKEESPKLIVRTTKYQIQKLKIKIEDELQYFKSTSFDRQAII